MELQFYGGNCLTIGNKQLRVVVDDHLESYGQKSIARDGDLLVYTTQHADPKVKPQLLVDHAGEYEVGGVSVYGVSARAHMDEAGKKTATMYKIIVDDVRYLITGHVYPDLTERQLEDIGAIDVMLVPVGGNGFTLDGVGALKLIKEVEPKIVIPTHYADKAINYEVPQTDLEEAIKALGMEVSETVGSLKLKSSDIGEGMRLIILNRQ